MPKKMAVHSLSFPLFWWLSPKETQKAGFFSTQPASSAQAMHWPKGVRRKPPRVRSSPCASARSGPSRTWRAPWAMSLACGDVWGFKWAWVKITPLEKPQVLVHVSIYQGFIFGFLTHSQMGVSPNRRPSKLSQKA